MTGSHHGLESDRRRRGRRAVGAACLALAVGLALAAGPAVAEDEDVIQVVSTNVQGKNVYIPSTIVVEEGKPHVLSVFNTTDTPHGFSIDGVGIEVVLPPQQETRIELPAIEGERILRIHCQLHPPHRTGRLVVLDLD